MRFEVKEFAEKKYVELYLNEVFKDPKTPVSSFQITPYAIEPNVPRYLVTVSIMEDSDIQNIDTENLPQEEVE